MTRQWTSDQKKVIELHNRNILVSAAAGSGKTAVLVERIIEMITDDTKNIDIDRLVVVTFTKAAAGEMKQRISDAIEAKLELDSDNTRLQRQLTLLNNASITTIDSFCLNIVRNYFADADIDPGFRTADEGELKLLQANVMSSVLEEFYGSNRKEFFDFVESYGTGRDDTAVEDIILRLFNFSRSYPWPLEWLNECDSAYDIATVEELGENASIKYLMDYVKNIIADYDKKYQQLQDICAESDGPKMYLPMLVSDYYNISNLLQAENFEQLGNLIKNITFDRLSSKKDETVDADKKEYVKAVRDAWKKTITNIGKKTFVQDSLENLNDITLSRSCVKMMVEITKHFYEEYQAAKREKNIIDFNDMEHLALDILVKNEDGKKIYTSAADSLSEFYEEILIDEYQDSNYLQEEILYSISRGREDESKNNVFMVGDVKQSIYKFRLARPDIFTQKYYSYSEEDSYCQKIELSKNFRSRAEVLRCINDVFFQVMRPYGGGIDYNEKIMLNPGMEFPETPKAQDYSTSVWILNETVEDEDKESRSNSYHDSESDTDDTDLEGRELEGALIASRIKDMVAKGNGFLVYDNRLQSYRNARYSDIVILTRTVSGWASDMVNVLMSHGIPAYSDTTSGYFNTREIKLIMSMLSIIDNPLQDIPLTAVLLSYFGRFTTDELAALRIGCKDLKMYEVLCDKSSENEKISAFLESIAQYREYSRYISIHDLIWKIVYDTGFYDYVGTMPAGERRQANVDMLMEKAASFSKTSYRGLFNFLKYIEKIQKYDVDYGQASILGENEDLVRVMSIHKSKVLEFPIVIVAGMGKKFNNMDAISNVVIDADLGIGATAVDLEQRTKMPTIIKNAIACKIKMDNLSEELRILYVAMTRAKEKLILVGTVKNSEKSMSSWKRMSFPYTFADLEGCSNYFDLVIPTALRDYGNSGEFKVHVVNTNAVNVNGIESNEVDKLQSEQIELQLKSKNCENVQNSELLQNIVSTANTEFTSSTELPTYPYGNKEPIKAKITVTELKKMQHDSDIDELQSEEEFVREIQTETEEIIPKFIAGKQEVKGNDRGTAYHRIMECLDYSQIDSLEDIVNNISNMEAKHKITSQQREAVSSDKIFTFCNSSIGKRIKHAFIDKNLHREQPFVYAIEHEAGEYQLVQGVVDLYIIENNQITIVDYKTDRVLKGSKGEQELIKRYKIQLDYYADAISRLTGKTVAQKIIYSFHLDKEIEV